MKNFQELANKFYSLTFSLDLRSVFLKITAFAATIAIFLINMAWVDTSEPNIMVHIAGTIASTLLIPALFMIMVSPLTKMAVTSFYLKSRQAKGLGHSTTPEESELSQLTQFTTKRKVFTAASLVLSLLAGNAAYISMVTPMSKPVLTVRPAIEKVTDSENAWVEYDKAILDLVEMPTMLSKSMDKKLYDVVGQAFVEQLKNPAYSNLEKAAYGEIELTEQQITFIEKHQKAIEHLLKGAKLSKSQFYTEIPNVVSPVPNLLQMRALTNVAAAQARYLQQQGKVKEAVELALANYKMATDIGAEKNATLISGLISVVCRGIATKSLVALVYSGATTAEMDKEIARAVTEQDLRMPNTYQLFCSERQTTQITFEDAFIKNDKEMLDEILNKNEVPKALVKLLPGLRVRVYEEYSNLSQEHLSLVRDSLENWDFVAANEANKTLNEKASYWYGDFSLGSIMGRLLFYVAVPNGLASMKSLYTNDVLSKTLVSFATCSAYKKNHGEFPSDLGIATKEAGLSIPLDLATKEAVSYRLEGGHPVVWFAGVDGKNDGGKMAYEIGQHYTAVNGKDFILTYGQIPFQKK